MSQINLTWDQAGAVDYFEVIRATYNLANVANDDLPSPIATDITDTAYTDTSITAGVTYFYVIRAVRGTAHAISQQTIKAAEKLLIHLPLFENASDYGSAAVSWVNNGAVSFSDSGALFDSFSQYLSSSFALNLNNDFKVSLEVNRLSADNTYPNLFTNDSGSWSSGNFAVCFAGENANLTFKNRIMIGVSYKYNQESSDTFINDQYYSVVVERASNIIKVYVDDIEVISKAQTDSINVNSVFRIGCATNNGTGGQFLGYIRNFKVYDLS